MKLGICRRSATAAAVLAAGLGLAACGTESSSSLPAASMPAPSHPAVSHSATPSRTSSGSAGGVPLIQPATVVSRAGGSVVLKSPDSVPVVNAFYVRVANSGGWTIVSSSMTTTSGYLLIKKGNRGATISVAPSGSGSVITIVPRSVP